MFQVSFFSLPGRGDATTASACYLRLLIAQNCQSTVFSEAAPFEVASLASPGGFAFRRLSTGTQTVCILRVTLDMRFFCATHDYSWPAGLCILPLLFLMIMITCISLFASFCVFLLHFRAVYSRLCCMRRTVLRTVVRD